MQQGLQIADGLWWCRPRAGPHGQAIVSDQLGVGPVGLGKGVDFGGLDDTDAVATLGQEFGQGDSVGSRGFHSDPRPVVAETLQSGGKALWVVVELFVTVLAFAESGHIEFVFGDIYVDGDLGYDGKLQERFIWMDHSGSNAWFRLMEIQARPLGGLRIPVRTAKAQASRYFSRYPK